MGVYIKDMELPKPGRYEAVIIVLDKSTAEIAISPAEDDIGYWKEYPLSPVPKHGRLIDADLLMSTFKDRKGNYYGYDSAVKGEAVDAAPTIIPADQAEEGK